MAAVSTAAIFFMKRRKFDLDACLLEAKKYTSRKTFLAGSGWAYHGLNSRKLMDVACSHMAISPLYSTVRWTPESVFAEAAKYKNRAEFKREASGAHGYALEHGLLDQLFAHRRDCHGFWHVFELAAVARKYDNKANFMRSEPAAYNFMCKHGLIVPICSHMTQRRSWDKPAVLAEAAQHQSRGSLRILASGAYKHADQYGYLDEACAHMPPPSYGFAKDKAASLYYLRILVPGLEPLFKIGITNRNPEDRIAGMGLPEGVTAEVLQVIGFDNGQEARRVEKILHRRHRQYRYNGAAVMKNGNTELFTIDVLASDPD